MAVLLRYLFVRGEEQGNFSNCLILLLEKSEWNGYWAGIQANKETEFSITTKITRDVESLRGWIQTKCNKQTSGKITVSDIKIVQKRAK